jgi:septum formation protein
MIYLASGSPRRAELLLQIGVDHRVLMPEGGGDAVDETPHAGENPETYATRVALEKTRAGWLRLLASELPKGEVLGADTTVAVGETILGKPAHETEARRFLRLLSGREHQVITVVAMTDGLRLEHRLSRTRVWFRSLDSDDIDAYLATGECWGKAGGYGIQGYAGRFIERIEGSYSGVMGLPVFETDQLLRIFEQVSRE